MRHFIPMLTAAIVTVGPAVETPIVRHGGDSSGMYSLATGADGRTYLGWIDANPDKSHTLRFSRLDSTGWSAAQTVSTGTDWFVNWADHPSVSALADGTVLAHWLVNNPGTSGSYGYGIRIARSTDAGQTWSEIFKAGLDNGSDYSGFVSLLPEARGFSALYLTPLRPSGAASNTSGHGEGEHVKTLSVARFSPDATLLSDTKVDLDVCSCCNTSMVQTDDGPIAAYRDHQGGIRDISVIRLRDGRWTRPATVHADRWAINGCPTNGPVLAARGRRVAISWFTAAQDIPRVRVAFSDDAGATFSKPSTVDGGKPIGWPAVVLLEDGSAVVTWLEAMTGGDGEVRLRRVWPDGRTGDASVVVRAKAGRSTGVPQMVQSGDHLVVAWRNEGVMTATVPVPNH